MSQRIRAILQRYAEIDRPILRGVVSDLSRYTETGPAFIGVKVLGQSVQAVYRDGRRPKMNEAVQVIRMSKDSNLYFAFPLPPIIILEKVFPFLVPAFDNTWYKSQVLHIGTPATHPDDDEWAVVLGRRNDNSWVVRSNYPHSADAYALQKPGYLRDTMRAYFAGGVVYHGVDGLATNEHITWALPDDGSDPGLAVNTYVTRDDATTWFTWSFMNGLVDIGDLYTITCFLKNGGRQLGYFLPPLVGGSPVNGATFQLIQITGRHWRFGYVLQCEQISTEFGLRQYEIIALIGPAGITVFEYQRPTGVGATRTAILNTWVYTFPETVDCPWEGRMWLVTHAGGFETTEVWFLPGYNRDRSPVKMWTTLAVALRGGTPAWSEVTDFADPLPFDPEAYDDVVLSETSVRFTPNLAMVDNTVNLWPISSIGSNGWAYSPVALVDGTEAAFRSGGAAEAAFPPRLRWANVEGFEQYRQTVDDEFVFKLVNYAFTGSDPGAGAAFDGDGDSGLTYGPRMLAIYEDFDSVVKVQDSTGTLLEDTADRGQEYAFWGDWAYTLDGAIIDTTGEGLKWWDAVPDDEE